MLTIYPDDHTGHLRHLCAYEAADYFQMDGMKKCWFSEFFYQLHTDRDLEGFVDCIHDVYQMDERFRAFKDIVLLIAEFRIVQLKKLDSFRKFTAQGGDFVMDLVSRMIVSLWVTRPTNSFDEFVGAVFTILGLLISTSFKDQVGYQYEATTTYFSKL